MTTATSQRGYAARPTASAPQCNNPNLLFWEGHADLGGPITRDKVWFFAAYNHFKIDKVVSGVPQDIATDLGIFDNFTVKGTVEAVAEQHAHRLLPARAQAEAEARSVDAGAAGIDPGAGQLSWMYKGEWQSVLSNRAFLNVNVGNFTLDLADGAAVDPAAPADRCSSATRRGCAAPAGTRSRPTATKPQIKAQLTYYLPNKGGSHDFKFGFEIAPRLVSPRHQRPVRDRSAISFPAPPPRRATPIASASRTSAPTAISTTAGRPRRTSISTTRSTGRIAGRRPIGFRSPLGCGLITRICRTPMVIASRSFRRLPRGAGRDGGRIFPAETNVTGASLLTNTDLAARIGVSYSLDRKGQSVLKAFYGRYYNNLADSFSAANPGGTNYVEYAFNDANKNGKYDGVSELGALPHRIGGADAPVNPDMKTRTPTSTALTYERQFWGESSVRGTYVRRTRRTSFPTTRRRSSRRGWDS